MSKPFYASDYFDQIYEYALQLTKKGLAYVDDLSAEDTDKYRGAPDRPGKESPFRNRSVEENLDLVHANEEWRIPDGARTLRAKIDMGSPNIWMRDPVLYRIRHAKHHHTGDKWCIYPMYDFAHCLSDYIEGITHSICRWSSRCIALCMIGSWRILICRVRSSPIRIRQAHSQLHDCFPNEKLIQLVNDKLFLVGMIRVTNHFRHSPPRGNSRSGSRVRLYIGVTKYIS